MGVGWGEREKEKEKERGSIGGIEVERDGSFKVRTSTTGSRILELKKIYNVHSGKHIISIFSSSCRDMSGQDRKESRKPP